MFGNQRAKRCSEVTPVRSAALVLPAPDVHRGVGPAWVNTRTRPGTPRCNQYLETHLLHHPSECRPKMMTDSASVRMNHTALLEARPPARALNSPNAHDPSSDQRVGYVHRAIAHTYLLPHPNCLNPRCLLVRYENQRDSSSQLILTVEKATCMEPPRGG